MALGIFSQYSTAGSGTVNVQDTQQDVILVHDTTLAATLTITLPAAPVDGQRITILSVGGVTTLTLSSSIAL